MGQRFWLELLRSGDLEVIIAAMLDDGPTGRLLRSNSPFLLLLNILDDDLRRRLWKQAKAELEAL